MDIFLLNRPDGPEILYDERDWNKIYESLQEGECRGWYGSYPDDSIRVKMKNALTFLAEKVAEHRFHEKDFFIRYVLSFVLFLITFFLLSYVFRDPIPLVDEVLISLAAAIGGNIWWRRRRVASITCDRLKLDLRGEVDLIPFEENDLLSKLELYLQSLDNYTTEQLIDIDKIALPIFWDSQDKLCKRFLSALQDYWTPGELAKEIRSFKKRNLSKEGFKDLSMLILWMKLS